MTVFLTITGIFGALLWLAGCLSFVVYGDAGAIHETEAILVMGFGGLTNVISFGLAAILRELARRQAQPKVADKPDEKSPWG